MLTYDYKPLSFSTRCFGERFIWNVGNVCEQDDHESVPSLLSCLIHTVALDMELRVEDADDRLWCRYTCLLRQLYHLYLYSIGEYRSKYGDYSPMQDDESLYLFGMTGCLCPNEKGHVLQWIKQYNSAPFSWENIRDLIKKVGGVLDNYVGTLDEEDETR